MNPARNIPASKSSAVRKINVQSIAVFNSRPGTSSAETSNSNSSGTLAHIPLPADKEVVQDESKLPVIHLDIKDYPDIAGDISMDSVFPAHLVSTWSVSPTGLNNDDDFQEKPKPLTLKRKVAPRKAKGESGRNNKRRRSQATKHTASCNEAKTPCYGACDSELQKLLELPITAPAPAQQQLLDDDDCGLSASQVLEIVHTVYEPIASTSLLSQLSSSSGSLPAIHAEPAQQAAAMDAETNQLTPAAEPIQMTPAVERRTEAEPIQQAVKFSKLDTYMQEFDSLLERQRALSDVVHSSTAKSLEVRSKKAKLEAKMAEMERQLSELDKQQIAHDSTISSHQSELDDVSAEIDRWRSWARRMV